MRCYPLSDSLVGPSGLEPPTSRLSGVRSNLLSYEPILVIRRCFHFYPHGGDERDRTADPLLAKQVLSQLSYTPLSGHAPQKLNNDLQVLELTLDVLPFFRTVCSP